MHVRPSAEQTSSGITIHAARTRACIESTHVAAGVDPGCSNACYTFSPSARPRSGVSESAGTSDLAVCAMNAAHAQPPRGPADLEAGATEPATQLKASCHNAHRNSNGANWQDSSPNTTGASDGMTMPQSLSSAKPTCAGPTLQTELNPSSQCLNLHLPPPPANPYHKACSGSGTAFELPERSNSGISVNPSSTTPHHSTSCSGRGVHLSLIHI